MQVATAAIIEREGKYLIAKRKAGGIVGGKWEFPGGKLELDETPEQCLVRELEEELGIRAQIGDFFDEHVHCYKSGKMRILAYNVRFFEGRINLIEHEEIRWILPSQLQNFAFIGNDKPIIRKIALLEPKIKC